MSIEIKMLLAFLMAGALAAIFTPVAIKIAPKIGAMDIPKDERRMHTKAMPRFGGIAIFIGAVATILAFNYNEPKIVWIVLGSFVIYLLGVIDDLHRLPAKLKFLVQSAVAVWMYFMGIRIEFLRNWFGTGKSELAEIVCFIVTFLWIVGVTNTINLIDGLDGLAAGTSAITSLSIAYVCFTKGQYPIAIALFAVAGSAIGFLPFNFNPAKIFMGDGGSLFFGFMLATLATLGTVKSTALVAIIVPVLILGVPIFDTLFAILRRVVNKRPIMEPDKEHLHHRLMKLGYGQRRSTLTLYCISGVMGVCAITLSRSLYIESIALFLVAVVMIYILITDVNQTTPHIKKVENKDAKKA